MNRIFNVNVYDCLAFFTCCLLFGQVRPSAIYGDYNGYWVSQSNTGYVTSRDNNNLIGLTVNGVTYATGVNDVALTSHGISPVFENYRAFPTSFSVLSTAANFLVGMPRFINGVEQNQTVAPSLGCDVPLGYYLRDGEHGLNLGTAVFNIPKQELTFYVNVLADINPNCINDDIPDIIVTQVGAPSSTYDIFKFTDLNGNTIGVEKQINFSSVTPSGLALWNFYSAGSCPHMYYTPNGFSNTTRDVRVLTFKLSDFGITSSNYTSAVKFIQLLSGDSDVAFSAYSTNSMSLYCLESAVTSGTALNTQTGITTLGRSGTESDNWPMVRKGGYLALESTKKPFVPTRVSTAGLANITNPVEGMMVYDTTDNCLKVYVNATIGWKCYNRKTCP
ncbi:hypothetical protein [Epilithonimonas hungarica]|jgi:hypothetical protein|uniref:Uncharacterized protein n=1 Tax=Epilithonimonas hungarica TaxID=454006 RepID=A0A1G7JR08_9FLAO|nr:hypothetical protein [Epilithonimonas hungarica]MDP9956064.1 hypothetical protein [Epilithonimonas hungarica]MPT31613.1 hypothetical protein [Chryseobacterium sp.]SDF27387.1 hypothetical protein SAMN05421825_1465 [Epilithonimonas hungarica]